MTATALVQARIDPAIRDRAATVLDGMGLTVSDAVRILLTRVATEGALPAGLFADRGCARHSIAFPASHDAWFRAKVMQALADTHPAAAHDEVEQHFADRRAASRAGEFGPRR